MNKNETILITGSTGMSGSSIKQKLQDLGYTDLLTPSREELDYTRKFCVQEYFEEHKPDRVFHCAGYISSHMSHSKVSQSELLIEDTYINFNVIKAACSTGVKKLVAMGSCWAYDRGENISETSWKPGSGVHLGVGHDTAKTTMITALELLKREQGFDSTVLMIPPLYNNSVSDNVFDRHVVANVANRIYCASKLGSNTVTLEGCATNKRQLVHTDDFSEAAVLAMDIETQLLNVAAPEVVEMQELALAIANRFDYTGDISWTNSKTNPGPQSLDCTKIYSAAWLPKTSFSEGVKRLDVL